MYYRLQCLNASAAYRIRVIQALKHMEDIKDISRHKGKSRRLAFVTRVKASARWWNFKPESIPVHNFSRDRQTEMTAQEPNISKMTGDRDSFSCNDDSDERNSILPATFQRRNRRTLVKVRRNQLSNYEWWVEWLFKLNNHPCTLRYRYCKHNFYFSPIAKVHSNV